VLGVDDWARCKGQTYGTLVVGLKERRVLDLLPDRTAATLANWLKEQPTVQIITRDRSTEYARGAALGAPQAVQVADRWRVT
jgi:transposase